MSGREAAAAAAPSSKSAVKAYRLKFTGSGKEYFRVWFVNVLLVLLTLGIYTPWARKRTAEYFFGHSVLARSPLEFTAETKRMVIGFFICIGLYKLFDIAVQQSNTLIAGLAMFSAAAAVPYLWGSARRFRVTATRWRGLRLRFGTNWKEIYWASWPIFLIALQWFFIYAGLDMLRTFRPTSLLEENRPSTFFHLTVAEWVIVGVGLIGTWLCWVRVLYNYQKLTVERTYIGVEQGVFRATYKDFVRIWLVTTLMAVAGLAVVLTSSSYVMADYAQAIFTGRNAPDKSDKAASGAAQDDPFLQAHQDLIERMQRDVSSGSVDWAQYNAELEQLEQLRQSQCQALANTAPAAGAPVPDYCHEGDEHSEPELSPEEQEQVLAQMIQLMTLTLLLVFLPLTLVFEIIRSYQQARLHRLVWNRTGVSDIVRFRSKLKVSSYILLRLKNWVLTVLTLGLYRPFARVSEYKARWASTTVHARGGASRIQNLLTIQQEGGAFADAIADFAGFDIIS